VTPRVDRTIGIGNEFTSAPVLVSTHSRNNINHDSPLLAAHKDDNTMDYHYNDPNSVECLDIYLAADCPCDRRHLVRQTQTQEGKASLVHARHNATMAVHMLRGKRDLRRGGTGVGTQPITTTTHGKCNQPT
jgi:hypothetical protein